MNSIYLWFGRIMGYILVVIVLAASVVSFAFTQWSGDGGVAVGEAYRIVQGEYLYSDVASFWMPLTSWLLGASFTISGASITTIYLLSGILFLSCILFLGYFSRVLLQTKSLVLLSMLLFLVVTVPPSVNHNWLGLVVSALFVIFVDKRYKESSRKDSLAKGFLLGLLFITNLWQFGATLLGWLLFKAIEEKRFRYFARESYFIMVGALVPVSGVVVWSLVIGVFEPFVYRTLIFPFTHYLEGNTVFTPSPLLYSTAFWFAWYLWQHRRTFRFTSELERLLVCVGFTYWLASLVNPSQGHIVLGYIFTLPVFVKSMRDFVFGGVFMLSRLGVLGLFAGAVFLAGVLTAGYRKGMDVFEPWQVVATPKGYVLADNNQQVVINKLQESQMFLRGKEVFIAPWSSELYFLFDLDPSVPYTHMGAEHLHPDVQREIIDYLENNHEIVVVYVSSLSPLFPYTPQLLEEYLEVNYELVNPFAPEQENETLRLDGVWVRR